VVDIVGGDAQFLALGRIVMSVLFAIGGYSGSGKGFDWPDCVGYIIIPFAIVGIWYACFRKADKDDNDDDDKKDE